MAIVGNKQVISTHSKWRILLSLSLALASLSTLLSYSYLSNQSVYAQTSSQIEGYAWSSNIGWVSFGGSGYGLSVASNGVISGYAWSPNIGWISANSSQLSGCPSSPCTATINSNGELRGWLKAISGGTSQSGGWDGFISLSGTNYGPVKQSNGSFSGYAWGSDVVGWVDFRYASTDYASEPTADLKVRLVGEEDWQDGLTINPTDEIELAWNQSSTANTVSCESVPPTYGFSTGGAASGVDSTIEAPIGNSSNVYRLICYSSGGQQKVDTVTVTTNGGVGAKFCDGTKVDFVRRGADVELCWELGTNNPEMCSIKAGGIDVLNPLGTESGTVTYQGIIGEINFSLQCIGGDGDNMNVRVLPEVQET